MDALPPTKRKNTFGILAPPSPKSDGSDTEMHASCSPKYQEDESGKYTLNSTGPEKD
jgi:hypothetical protein